LPKFSRQGIASSGHSRFNNTTDEFGAGFTTGRSREGSLQEKKRKPVVAEMKARQAAKIRELGHALVDGGFLTLDEQSSIRP
jgi:hypothetical protein